ncbi:MAG TPA: YlcI/YnfO family protein [Solirubrobacteraceae bacterium]|nr:YlcI/YnfO family protein [Solirubrobacteraceae bacterium]
MELSPHVLALQEQLAVAAEAGGDEARALAERLSAPLDSAVRLMLLEVLAAAAAEITQELAPGSVELRLRAGGPEFVVTPPPADHAAAASYAEESIAAGSPSASASGEGGVSRINLRLPDELKSRIEQAAEREGLSTNAWLVRAAAAAAAAADRGAAGPRREHVAPTGGQRYRGWGR